MLRRYEDPTLPGKLAAVPAEETSGPAPNLEVMAGELRADLKTFEDAQVGWTEARKIRDEALLARRAAEKRLRVVVVNVARIQEGYYRLAGFDDLADRLR